MNEPKRIQRKRSKGWRMPPNTVAVSRPSKWGNPFATNKTTSNAQTSHLFRAYVIGRLQNGTGYPLRELRGKDLACWCPLVDEQGNPVPCHADVLLELANKESGGRTTSSK